MCTGSRSIPRQGLPGDRQGSPWFFWSHSRTKYPSQGDKTPARGACREGQQRHLKTPARGSCREGQPRHLKELAAARHASRQGPVSDKLPDATRQRPRQGACRGKLPLFVPALQQIHQRVALGPFQAYVAGGCAARGARWQAALTRSPSWRAVASLTVPFALFRRRRRAFNALVPCRQG